MLLLALMFVLFGLFSVGIALAAEVELAVLVFIVFLNG